jgi:hypothetical protein
LSERAAEEKVMANRNLTSDELKLANGLLVEIRTRLSALAEGDAGLLFAYRRKIAKELGYDERGKSSHRNKIKAIKWGLQGGKCEHCKEDLPLRYSELDRKNAADGYTVENTELVHASCHIMRQSDKKYS